MKLLVSGWFSFEQMGASAGDLLARDLVCAWLREAGHKYDIALASPCISGVAWQDAKPDDYAGVVFVCGPFGNGPPLTQFLPHFAGAPLIGVNLTMLQDLSEWNPFDLLLERDSSAEARPDLVFLAKSSRVPVVGLILVHHQKEYGKQAKHADADAALRRLVAAREVAVVPIDTRLDENQVGLRTPAEVESLIARMDVVITTRLHGMVMALKNGVPPLVVDPIAGGAKILRQAEAIGWTTVFIADALDNGALERAFDFCLSHEARQRALQVRAEARRRLATVREQFLEGLEQFR